MNSDTSYTYGPIMMRFKFEVVERETSSRVILRCIFGMSTTVLRRLEIVPIYCHRISIVL